MRMFSAILAVGFVAASTITADAQQQTSGAGGGAATGKVIGPTSQPEPGIPVEVNGPLGKTFAVTDQNGKWSVYNLPAGKYDVKPADAYKSGDNHGISFTVEEKSTLDKLFGGRQPTIETPDIRVGKESVYK